MEEAVLYAVENNIATITMNRPKSLNSMNDALIDGLHAAITKCVLSYLPATAKHFVPAAI